MIGRYHRPQSVQINVITIGYVSYYTLWEAPVSLTKKHRLILPYDECTLSWMSVGVSSWTTDMRRHLKESASWYRLISGAAKVVVIASVWTLQSTCAHLYTLFSDEH